MLMRLLLVMMMAVMRRCCCSCWSFPSSCWMLVSVAAADAAADCRLPAAAAATAADPAS